VNLDQSNLSLERNIKNFEQSYFSELINLINNLIKNSFSVISEFDYNLKKIINPEFKIINFKKIESNSFEDFIQKSESILLNFEKEALNQSTQVSHNIVTMNRKMRIS
jgi:hypothetical protein